MAWRITSNPAIFFIYFQQNQKEAKVTSGKVVIDNASKRMAEASPEGGPDQKRAVFGDITNAVEIIEAQTTKKEEKRVTRSQSFNSLKLSQEQRKSKRLSGKTAEISINKSEDSESISADLSDAFESAEESLNSTVNVASLSESKSSLDNSRNMSVSTRVKKSNVPEGVMDFDAETSSDLFSSPLYVQDIFQYFKEREVITNK